MKALTSILVFFSVVTYGQLTIETIDRYTNSYKNKTPKDNIYLVLSFTSNFDKYFFNEENNTLLTVLYDDNTREEKVINKSDFYLNKKTKLQEYYFLISNNRKISEVKSFDLYLSSIDGKNYTKQSFKNSDKKKLKRFYEPPAPNASTKKKLKYFRKTGNSQGQLTGANTAIVIKKRMSCKAKKRKYRKEGVNGVKEMTYGM